VNVTLQGPTECCAAKINPITLQLVCSCDNQASDNPGYIINRDCRKINVNKCAMGTSTCHRNAICLDKDASVNSSTKFECVCPPGLIGDGISSCNLYAYGTLFSLLQTGVTLESFDKSAFQMVLTSRNVIPVDVPSHRISIAASEYFAPSNSTGRRLLSSSDDATAEMQPSDVFVLAGGRRALLQATTPPPTPIGIQIDVTILSETSAEMYQVTLDTNASLMLESGYTVLQDPTNMPTSQAGIDEPTAAISPGFQITAVQFDDTTAQWLVDVKYTSGIPNTLTSLYVSRPGTTLPYTQATKNTYFISKHPCLLSSSVCCLNTYKDSYAIGSFGQNVTDVVGTCSPELQMQNTENMFDTRYSQSIVDNALSAYTDSSVQRINANQVRLRIAQTDLSVNGLGMRTPLEGNPTGYQLSFFVGMSYFTLLPANAMSVVASQTSITLAISNTVTFSFASSQDYSFVKYVTLSIMQNKWVDGLIERKMQFVQMGFVLPENSKQNMDSGLVPLTSIRFAISKTLPDKNNASLWTNPCFSRDSTGMYDASQVNIFV
jgi:hypothetical protein